MKNTLIILLTLGLLASIGYILYSKYASKYELVQKAPPTIVTVTPTLAVAGLPSPTVASGAPTIAPTSTAPTVAVLLPTSTPSTVPVVFEAEGTFTTSEKTILKTRWSEPYVMYQTGLGQIVSSIKFAKIATAPGYGYTFEAIMTGGGNESSLIAVSDSTPEWWVPGCMVACPFSDAFRVKYPEIVAKSNNP